MLQDDVAAEVRAELGRRNRTHADLARSLGWTEIYLSRRLTGRVPWSVHDIDAVARALEIPVSQLVSERPREATG